AGWRLARCPWGELYAQDARRGSIGRDDTQANAFGAVKLAGDGLESTLVARQPRLVVGSQPLAQGGHHGDDRLAVHLQWAAPAFLPSGGLESDEAVERGRGHQVGASAQDA